MAVATLLRAAITSVAKTPAASITWFLESVNSRDDRLQWNLTVINWLSIATSVVRKIGVKIELDLGDGALTAIPGKDLDATITLSDSLDAYGVQTMDFSRFGDEQSPIKSSMLRRMGAVKLTGYRGTPGAIGSLTMFEGFIRQGSYSGYPPLGRIECLDSALEFVDKPFIYSLEPGAQLSREEILLDVCDVHDVPVGTWDLPMQDGLRGGKVFKEINEGGEKKFMDWLIEWLIPIGCRPQMRDGKLNIKRFTTEDDPIRTLSCADIRGLTIEPPQTNEYNAVSMSSSIFNYTGPEGRRTLPPAITEVESFYAPQVATNRQDKTTGTVTATGLVSSSAVSRVTSKTIATRTYDGGTLVSEVVEEYGYYAHFAARYQQAITTGTITHNAAIDVWQFPDGTWRATQQEDFQIIRRRSMTRNFDDAGYLQTDDVFVEGYAPIEIPRGTLNATTAVEEPAQCYLTEDGIGWAGPSESFTTARERNQITYGAGEDTRLAGISVSVYSDAKTVYTPVTKPTGAHSATVYYFGPTDAKKYGRSAGTNQLLATSNKTYTPIDEQSHRVTVATTPAVAGKFPRSWQSLPTSGSTVAQGSIPYLDQLTAYQVAQAATVTVYDDVKIAMARGVEVIDGRQNDYCETDGELRTAAFEALRENDHLIVNIDMDVDMICEAGKVVAISGHPKFNYETISLLIMQRDISVTPATGENSQALACRYYPPELRAA